MHQQKQYKKSYSEQKLRTTRQSSAHTGGGIFRIPRGKGFFILLVIVILASYYQSSVVNFFTKKAVADVPVTDERVISPDSEAVEFTTMIMATLEETWRELFQSQGLKYQPPKLVTYRDAVSTACGGTQAIGTFYCPQDDTVYVSLTLYDNMHSTLGAGGDFTHGYMIAHAVGHHIQKFLKLGISLPMTPEQELQTDCFAGLWGHRMAEQQILSAGDLQPAMNVAQIINAEKKQLHPGLVIPEQFAYSDLEHRYQSFNRGFVSGELQQCLNFAPLSIKP